MRSDRASDASSHEQVSASAAVVGADLVAEPAGPRVDHHAHLALVQTERGGRGLVGDEVDGLHFEKVVPRADAARLMSPPLKGALAHGSGVGVWEDPAVLAAC